MAIDGIRIYSSILRTQFIYLVVDAMAVLYGFASLLFECPANDAFDSGRSQQHSLTI